MQTLFSIRLFSTLVMSSATTKTYCINLDRSTQRLEEFERHNCSAIAYERFPAVDGKTVAREGLAYSGLMTPEILQKYKDGAVGAALSHRSLWLQCIADQTPLTVCEDDAIFHPEFRSIQSRILGTLDGDFDVLLWGWNFDSPMTLSLHGGVNRCAILGDQNGLRESIEAFKSAPIRPDVLKLHAALGLVCYTVTPKGAKKLLERCFPLRPMSVAFPGLSYRVANMGLDVVTGAAYPTMDSYVAFPPPVITRNDEAISTIQS
ncbi:glycosyltransferase family 25 protein [Uliginosibacterium sp. H3]|uniref:Glycosyltransferase family 25 protein n=1 Tax=Uliginosibacterium silvisoli TaxID=3114758 RepID=A0ABU6JYL0_9RHOO|nr:glycosyltransferase family 25 protein [Uliginosibacterium sp. H3]